MSAFSNRLKEAMRIRDLRAVDLVRATGIAKSRISQYVNGIYEAKQTALYQLAKALNVSEAWLMGYDVPMERSDARVNQYIPADARPVKRKRLPMLGNVACGEPIYANEEHDSFVDAAEDIDADFCLTAKGDSMINARIFDGDVLFVRSQQAVDNGEIAVVLIDDEATVKRVYYDKEANTITLVPENPTHKVMRYSGSELNNVRIIGKVIVGQYDVE